MSQTTRKPVLFSGIQPSGHIHLGNYIGAITNFIRLEDEYDCLFSIVDLHALTVRQDPAGLRRKSLELAALYIACGLNPERSIIYCQSNVPQHAELAWILNCFTYMGELNRMTQFKDKSLQHKDNINAGLFTYPVLMAADILLYQTDLVPVGADQKQHLEITRDIAERLNAIHPGLFKVPEPYIPKQTARIMSLADPERKMSKSDVEDSSISLTDSPDVVMRKFKRAVTDSDMEIRYDPQNKPGVSNLLAMHSALSGERIEDIVNRLSGQGYGKLKEEVAQAAIETLKPIQERFHQLVKDKDYMSTILKHNAERAQAMAIRTLRKVYKKLGLYQP
ncbi:MAG TPA: tryptophan--tRNA ligase [Clostridiales bacterium]|jgi:tryptophanyl-tRNA synthetase|nr:tryptophan--tRNA ligase [Clostridiales bacterium]